MTPLLFALSIFGIGLFAGLLGALLGLGGGIIVVPALTLLMGLDIRYAIGASIVSVIATSSGAAAAYVRENLTNLRLAMLLEVATSAGALSGAYVAGLVPDRWLFVIFALLVGYTAVRMFANTGEPDPAATARDPLADRLKLHHTFFDPALGRGVTYRVARTKLGMAISYVAGIASGLLGIGGGVLKVPIMNLAMGVPIKVASATSNFMIGVTAAASAGVYFVRGDINPLIAGPVAAGVLLGATGGSKLLGRTKSGVIRVIFVVVLVYVSIQMLIKGLR